MEEDGFTLVRYKRKPWRRAPRIAPRLTGSSNAGWYTVDELRAKLDKYQTELDNSDFFRQMCSVFDHACQVFRAQQMEECVPAFQSVVCYGLGSPSESLTALLQLCLLRILLRLAGNPSLFAYDPIWGPTDRELLVSLGCQLIDKDESCRRSAMGHTLFFMPYCEGFMYDNLLSANWSPATLPQIVLLGNDLRSLKEQRALNAAQLAHCIPLPDSFRIPHVFNIAFHVFSRDLCHSQQPDFWTLNS